ncbi:ATP-binding protein [Glycomyces sp. L485]|nr:ATP-binding protein [Glycomyces sp. L485]
MPLHCQAPYLDFGNGRSFLGPKNSGPRIDLFRKPTELVRQAVETPVGGSLDHTGPVSTKLQITKLWFSERGAVMEKPASVFDRHQEWAGLTTFLPATGSAAGGATLGVVSGRRRQGKSYLLRALAEAAQGVYFGATEATEAESIRQFTRGISQQTGHVPQADVHTWDEAVRHMFASVQGRPRPVVIDEFPFLTAASPALPSILQRELGPGGSGADSSARLILCGSALSVMGKLLSGTAPLRGRVGLELIIRPFGYRDAAEFWGIGDPRLAMLVHSVVGGTPAYRYEFNRGDVPAGLQDFDAWVTRTVLNPQVPLFREARYLLSEEPDIRDLALYQSVLAAIAAGNCTNGGIANYVGRKSAEIAHPLRVLEDCGLIERYPDTFGAKRVQYHISEPLITFYEAIMRTRWTALESGRAAQVWESVQHTFKTQVLGPHFEGICRAYVRDHDLEILGEFADRVGNAVVNDPGSRTQIEIDVAVTAAESTARRRVLALGEAKWGEVISTGHLDRLHRAQWLLNERKFDTAEAHLMLFSAAGFTEEVQAAAASNPRLHLVGIEDLYLDGI